MLIYVWGRELPAPKFYASKSTTSLDEDGALTSTRYGGLLTMQASETPTECRLTGLGELWVRLRNPRICHECPVPSSDIKVVYTVSKIISSIQLKF